ncbi:MAG: hypothetical protein JRG96_15975 [Deltaproteobacteria bacterium]|nr:hypothetical protein [Deltaproteobacteria bacterium]MBW2417914.1 hypothetical protein [Deltaproteobacteria bacterium]
MRVLACLALVALLLSCTDSERYRLAGSGAEWRSSGSDEILADLQPRYPDFFAVVLEPSRTQDLEILKIREDLEEGHGRAPFDALNAVAVAYFELNSRAERGLEDETGGARYLVDSFRATKLLSIPWRAYADIEDPRLRDAILDFYEDIARGEKRDAGASALRITRTVASLEKKEADPARLARIRGLTARLLELEASERDGASRAREARRGSP